MEPFAGIKSLKVGVRMGTSVLAILTIRCLIEIQFILWLTSKNEYVDKYESSTQDTMSRLELES